MKERIRKEKWRIEELEKFNKNYKEEIEMLQKRIKQNDVAVKVSKGIIKKMEEEEKKNEK